MLSWSSAQQVDSTSWVSKKYSKAFVLCQLWQPGVLSTAPGSHVAMQGHAGHCMQSSSLVISPVNSFDWGGCTSRMYHFSPEIAQPCFYRDSSGTCCVCCQLQVLQPAIELGESGFPVSPITAYYWGRGAQQLKDQGGSGIKALLQPDGTAPKPGQLQKNAHLAATFRSLAEHGAEEGKALTLFLPVVLLFQDLLLHPSASSSSFFLLYRWLRWQVRQRSLLLFCLHAPVSCHVTVVWSPPTLLHFLLFLALLLFLLCRCWPPACCPSFASRRILTHPEASPVCYTGFYKGRVAEALVAAVQERGGVLTLEDLSTHRCEHRDPIMSTYRGYHIYEVAPPTAVSSGNATICTSSCVNSCCAAR